jgi:2-oxoglutarate ferredoxin oxidoreductase subunit beta
LQPDSNSHSPISTSGSSPDLDVWVVTGDGDSLSIGGNHLLHALRRNVGLKILLFNNETYGLTKGQYSPTSRTGTRTPSSPQGSIDSPVSPGKFALGCGARFFARAIDTDKAGLGEVLEQAHAFEGAALTEIFQNCIVFHRQEDCGRYAAQTQTWRTDVIRSRQ